MAKPTRHSASATETLGQALEYRRRGWAVLPIKPAGKEPHHGALERVHGKPAWGPLAARPASEPEIRGWLEYDPAANIGIILGAASDGLVVADVDRPHAACELRFPPTPIVRARRGPHVYFRARGPLRTTATAWGELRGDGSFVVAPPSIHESGHEYYWLVSPDEVTPARFDQAQGARGFAGAAGTEVEVLLPRYPTGGTTAISGDGATLARLDHAVQAALATLGVRVTLGQKFACVLPGHGPDRHASAAMHRGPDGVWRYMDFHRPHDPTSLTLAEVRASLGAGRVVQLPAPSQSRWYRRLFYEAGVLRAEPVPIAVPAGCSRVAHRLAEGFALLLALRALSDGGPAPFARTFAGPWCNMGERQAGKGIIELIHAGVLVRAGRHGRLNLYLPASERQGVSVAA